jgi:hypothetical protein
MKSPNRYLKIIEQIFLDNYKKGSREVSFARSEIETVASRLGIKLPKNLGDLVYSFRYRNSLPESIVSKAPVGTQWIIRAAGRSQYCFSAVSVSHIIPSENFSETKLLDATPGVITKYAMSDEQALLAKLRYNRLIDIFTGVTCYSLQNHLRTTVPGLGQIEVDEIYVGVDRRGAHYVIPVQAKGGKDQLNVVQIEQDFGMAQAKFPGLVCRPVAAQFMKGDLIALFEFEQTEAGMKILAEKHYRLVPPDQLSDAERESYRVRGSE